MTAAASWRRTDLWLGSAPSRRMGGEIKMLELPLRGSNGNEDIIKGKESGSLKTLNLILKIYSHYFV